MRMHAAQPGRHSDSGRGAGALSHAGINEKHTLDFNSEATRARKNPLRKRLVAHWRSSAPVTRDWGRECRNIQPLKCSGYRGRKKPVNSVNSVRRLLVRHRGLELDSVPARVRLLCPHGRLYRPISARFYAVASLRASARILVNRLESRPRCLRTRLSGSVRRNISSTW